MSFFRIDLSLGMRTSSYSANYARNCHLTIMCIHFSNLGILVLELNGLKAV